MNQIKTMRWMTIILIGIAMILLQTAVLPRFASAPIRPDLVLAFLLVLGALGRGSEAWVLAWIGGLMIDCLSLERLGVAALSYLIIIGIVVLCRRVLNLSRLWLFVIFTVLSATSVRLMWMMYQIVFIGLEPTGPTLGQHLAWAVGSAWRTTLAAFIMYWAAWPFARHLGLRFEPRIRNLQRS